METTGGFTNTPQVPLSRAEEPRIKDHKASSLGCVGCVGRASGLGFGGCSV